MDRNNSGTKVSEEVTRESLIAISYLAPEKEHTDEDSTETPNDKNVVEAMKNDGEDKYRSKLISISYSESPDTKALPDLPGDIKG